MATWESRNYPLRVREPAPSHWKLLSTWIILTLTKNKKAREERVQESSMIRKQSSATDPQQSAEYMTTIMHWTINPCKTPEGCPTGHVFSNGETAGGISSCLACLNDIGWKGMLAGYISSSLTLPKWYLATFKFVLCAQIHAKTLELLCTRLH